MGRRYQITTTHWLDTPQAVRQEIVKMFGIERRGNARVYGNRVLSDGYRNEELALITIERLNDTLGSKYEPSDILKAFYDLVDRIEGGNKEENNNEHNSTTSTGEQSNDGEDGGNQRVSTEDEEGDRKDTEEHAGDVSTTNGESVAKPSRSRKAGGKSK